MADAVFLKRESIIAKIDIEECNQEGSRNDVVPTIVVRALTLLTWEEARNLANAIRRVVDIAEFG